jgi:hypothetical protein
MLKERLDTEERTEVLKSDACRHHWMIEPAEAPTSLGECKSCGSVKLFRNFLPELPWRERYAPKEPVDISAWVDVPEGEAVD